MEKGEKDLQFLTQNFENLVTCALILEKFPVT